jgi:hypothetical protein
MNALLVVLTVLASTCLTSWDADPRAAAGRMEAKLYALALRPAARDDGLEINDDTEILLDGKPCKYEDVPAGAEIVLLAVARDGRTVLKIHFRAVRPSLPADR